MVQTATGKTMAGFYCLFQNVCWVLVLEMSSVIHLELFFAFIPFFFFLLDFLPLFIFNAFVSLNFEENNLPGSVAKPFLFHCLRYVNNMHQV